MDQFRLWNDIAASFDATRDRTWRHVEEFLAEQPPGRVLDLMAGNGRHLAASHAAGHAAIATDWSHGLCQVAAAHAPSVRADATRLPFADDSFDAAVCVAGLHGLTNAADRAACVGEARRVLRPAGQMQWTVWSRNAPRFRDADLPSGQVDVTIPWRRDGHEVSRHLTLYTPESLAAELAAGGFEVLDVQELAIAADDPDNIVALTG